MKIINMQIATLFNEYKKGAKKYNDFNIEAIEFEKKKLKEVADFPSLARCTVDVDITVEEFKNLAQEEVDNYIGLITGTTSNNQVKGYVLKTKLSNNQISNEHIVSWTRINLTEFFIQDSPVCTNDDSFVMEANEGIYYKYLAYSASISAQKGNYNWGKKAGKNIVENIEIFLPVSNEKYSSFEIQKIIVEFIEYRKSIASKILDLVRQIKEKQETFSKKLLETIFTQIQ